MLRLLERVLGRAGIEVMTLSDPLQVGDSISDLTLDVALFDVNMPGMTGIELLALVKKKRPGLEVVIMTADASIQSAVAAVKNGAYDYLTKPFADIDRVIATVQHAAERRRLSERARLLEEMVRTKESFEDIVGTSAKMRAVFDLVDAVAKSSGTVLLLGESGTGKELVARALHRRSDRVHKSFLSVNCSALSETLLESELFGHAKGAFTGAATARKGLFEAAHGGTLFLDEIGDISPATQVRLLRVLQEGEVRRVGENEPIHVDVRIVAATHVNLATAVEKGKFRKDLFFRLHVIPIHLPPLRDRPEDIPSLSQHFVNTLREKTGKGVQRVSEMALQKLLTYSWPGNVRELENAIERGMILARGDEIDDVDLLPGAGKAISPAEVEAASVAHLPYTEAKKLAISAFDRRYIASVLRAHGGNLSAAARAAGMDRSNFRRLIKEYDGKDE